MPIAAIWRYRGRCSEPVDREHGLASGNAEYPGDARFGIDRLETHFRRAERHRRDLLDQREYIPRAQVSADKGNADVSCDIARIE